MAEATTQPLALQGRVAIVTGGSRGIGKAISLHLASLGANVVINYSSNSTQAEQLASQINADSPTLRAVAVRANISNPDQVKSLFDMAESTFNSPPHILVNSAGVMDDKYPGIANTAIEDFDDIINVNVRGAFLCCKEASNRIKRGGWTAFWVIGQRREDNMSININGGSIEARIRGVCGIKGRSRDDDKDTGKGAEREWDHGKLCGARAYCNGVVLCREDRSDD